MEPFTHALAALSLGRAGLDRWTRLATPMLLVSGLLGDVDWLSVAGGARAFLADHRTATDSLPGTALIAVLTAGFFAYCGRRSPSRRVRFLPALAVCAAGAGSHLLLDLTDSYGVKLLWPFSQKWYAWDVAQGVDPWVLLLLIAGLLLPILFGLINEEVGARRGGRRGRRGAILALAGVALYFGGRAMAHERALAILDAHTYAGETPLAVAAFPDSFSPLDWHGVVDTANAIGEIDVPLTANGPFDTDTAERHFKPPESKVLDNARQSAAARMFLNFARFPLASVEQIPGGYEVKIRGLRFTAVPHQRQIFAVVELDDQARVTAASLQFVIRR
jgi:inner membrane protein